MSGVDDALVDRTPGLRVVRSRDPEPVGPGLDGTQAVPSWEARSDLQLLSDQLHAMEAWHTAQRQQQQVQQSRGLSREMRLDLARRMDARKRAQQALVDRARTQLAESTRLPAAPRPRAVLVHRREWLRHKVEDELLQHGVEVVAHLDNGADGIGVLVVEQPDLLLVEDALPMVRGEAVIRAARQFSAGTRIAAQVDSDGALPAVREAGAHAVFTRRSSPADIGRSLAGLVGAARR